MSQETQVKKFYEEFYSELFKYKAKNTSEREGQATFNVMYTLHPNIADSLRGTLLDPFYKDSVINAFVDACFKKNG